MTDIVIKQKDNLHIRVECDAGIAYELSQHFTFDVPGAKYTPQYKARKWDGKIRLFSVSSKTIYVGLKNDVIDFAKKEGYSCKCEVEPIDCNLSKQQFTEFTQSLNFHSKNKKIELRDYQIDSAYDSIKNNRSLILSPTSSGKSAIIASIIRWHTSQDRKCLIIVPTVSLVSQMYSDFADYFSESDWKVNENCYKITSGAPKNNTYPVTISTWQSVYELGAEFFDVFDCVIVDECHLAKAKSITGIMEKVRNAPFRVGCTGTLDGTLTHELVLRGLFGSVYKAVTIKELMDNKQIAGLKVNCLILQYSDNEKQHVKKLDYQQEIDFLVSHQQRNNFIKNLALSRKSNTLVLFNLVERHGKPLYELINSSADDGRKVFLVHGGVDADEREQIRFITETERDAIIIASYGVFSTGVSIRNLHNVIFASPSKSRVRNLQSIGRGLRNSDNKEHCNLYDISDDLSWKSKKNFTLEHAVERIKIYASEGFTYKMIKVNVTNGK